MRCRKLGCSAEAAHMQDGGRPRQGGAAGQGGGRRALRGVRARQGRAAGAPGAGHAPRPGQGGWLLRGAQASLVCSPRVHGAERGRCACGVNGATACPRGIGSEFCKRAIKHVLDLLLTSVAGLQNTFAVTSWHKCKSCVHGGQLMLVFSPSGACELTKAACRRVSTPASDAAAPRLSM
jgi:hypothetical protein